MSEPILQEQLTQKEQLTQEELIALINVTAQHTCPVAQAPPFQVLINKLSRMIDELKRNAESN